MQSSRSPAAERLIEAIGRESAQLSLDEKHRNAFLLQMLAFQMGEGNEPTVEAFEQWRRSASLTHAKTRLNKTHSGE
jgi:hypothetical protein